MKIGNYDKTPIVAVKGYEHHAWRGYHAIGEELRRAADSLGRDRIIVTLDCYPGVREEEVLDGLKSALAPDTVLLTRTLMKSETDIEQMLARYITEDRVFGVIAPFGAHDFFDPSQLASVQEAVAQSNGVILICGVGASLVSEGDILVYADLARWEIQQRFRGGELGNWGADNRSEDVLRKYKRGFFIDWRVADRHKKKIFHRIDYFLDTNAQLDPKLATGEAVRAGMAQTVARPFRVVPYFDAGVWGGQWMKRTFDLPENGSNYAWCFDCVPEENSLLLQIGAHTMEFPAMDLVLFWPDDLLGHKVHSRFGAEFPIRFDMLDTMEGGNLSLQVHPLTEYIQEQFGMHYTQDESYYLLDCAPNTCVYLGLRPSVDAQAMLDDLARAQETAQFEAETYVNRLPVKQHDHVLIPAGTIHCSGADTMVLEISSTPYIFTFKLWDWGRLGLDGLPRPVHLYHGSKNIQFDRDTEWVTSSCTGKTIPLLSGDGWREERTGLHDYEFIETRRHWFSKAVPHDTEGNLHVLNLVQGRAAVVSSPTGAFDPFEVHYAETFIVPAGVGRYTITPCGGEGAEMATIKAYVRF